MKKLFYIGLILSLVACQPTKSIDYAIISGDILNNKAKEISIYDAAFNKKIIKIDEKGHFTDTIKINKGAYYSLLYQRTGIDIYLEPSFNLSIKTDTKNIDSTLIFTGKGLSENTFLLGKSHLLKSFQKYNDYKHVGSLTEVAFLQKMDSVKQTKLTFLNNTNDLSNTFKLLEVNDINYSWGNQLNNFEGSKRYISKDKSFKVSNGYYNYKNNLLKENDNLLGSRNYVEFFSEYANDLTQKAYKKDSLIDYSQTQLRFISDSIKNQELKNILLFKDAQYSITYVDDIDLYYKTYMRASTNKENNAKIETTYLALKKVSKGNPSPLFVDYENYKGGTTSLKDLKGKFVYIDVWATWCGPCKREIPYLKKIEKAYHGKNIAFVSMSVDTKNAHEAWRKMIKEKKLGGIQLFSDKNWKSKFVTDYMIKGIPRFILIDPQGNIVSSNAPRPSSPKLKELFKEYKL